MPAASAASVRDGHFLARAKASMRREAATVADRRAAPRSPARVRLITDDLDRRCHAAPLADRVQSTAESRQRRSGKSSRVRPRGRAYEHMFESWWNITASTGFRDLYALDKIGIQAHGADLIVGTIIRQYGSVHPTIFKNGPALQAADLILFATGFKISQVSLEALSWYRRRRWHLFSQASIEMVLSGNKHLVLLSSFPAFFARVCAMHSAQSSLKAFVIEYTS